jgi:hypothetical protein
VFEIDRVEFDIIGHKFPHRYRRWMIHMTPCRPAFGSARFNTRLVAIRTRRQSGKSWEFRLRMLSSALAGSAANIDFLTT